MRGERIWSEKAWKDGQIITSYSRLLKNVLKKFIVLA